MNSFALTFILMMVVVLGELLILKFYRHIPIPWLDVVFNLNSGHIVMWICRGMEVISFEFILRHGSLHYIDHWQPLYQWLFAFVAWDFCFYWMHRLHHRFPILWAVHVVHHQGEHFNLSLGIRNAWISSLTSLLFVAVLAVLGVPLKIFVVVSSIHYTVQLYNHNGLVNKSGFLEKIMVTPSHHRVHHGSHPVYWNRNFGGTLLIWDKLFGTFQAERDDLQPQYGVPGSYSSYNPVQANFAPLLGLINRRFSIAAKNKLFAVPDWMVGMGGLILFGLLIYYVNHEQQLHGSEKLLLFILLFSGTIALGGVSEARLLGLIAWGLLACIMPFLYAAHFGVRDGWGIAFFILLFMHGVDIWRRLFVLCNNKSGAPETT